MRRHIDEKEPILITWGGLRVVSDTRDAPINRWISRHATSCNVVELAGVVGGKPHVVVGDEGRASAYPNDHGDTAGRSPGALYTPKFVIVAQQVSVEMFGVSVRHHDRTSQFLVVDAHSGYPPSGSDNAFDIGIRSNLYADTTQYAFECCTKCAETATHVPRSEICLNGGDAPESGRHPTRI
jgi:hypothetical protein